MSTDSTQSLPEWTKRFLKVLAETSNIAAACRAARVDRSTPYHLRERREDFRQAWQDAMDDACDALELEARRRALESSDGMLQFLLKAHRPETYRETRDVNLQHSGGLEIREVIKRLGNDTGNL